MMKKLRIVLFLLILAFSFSVKAEVFFEIDCDSKEISDSKSVTCEGNLIYETEGITDIEINYNTNLDIKFLSISEFTISNQNNKIIIHTNTPLYDEIMNSTKIIEFTLSSNDNCNEEEKVSFSNIKINNKSDIVVDDIEEKFKVIKKEEVKKSSISTLDSITIDNVELTDFDKNKFEYKNIKVSNEIIFIDAKRTDDKSSATGLGNDRIKKGETVEHDIIVEAEDGTKSVYKLYITNVTPKETIVPTNTPTITPAITPTPIPQSKDNTLKTLELYNNKNKINFKFDSKKDKYDIKIDNEIIDKLTIKATLNDSKASFIKNYGPRDIKLEYGTNKILLKVKAENSEEKTYTLNIDYPDNRDNDNNLSSLIINDVIVDLDNDKLEVKLPSDTLKTKIEAVSTSDKAKIEFEDISLEVGDNELLIKVISEDGKTKEYHINVIREDKIEEKEEVKEDTLKIEENNNSNIIYYIIAGVFVVIVIIVIVIMIKIKKNKKSIEIEEI